MKYEIFELKCCDSIAPYNDYGTGTTEFGDCLPRSVKVSQVIDSNINFGMIYAIDPIKASVCFNSIGVWIPVYSYHAWTEKNNFLYESCRQWKNVMEEELDTDKKVMMFDISYIKKIQTTKDYKQFNAEIRKKLEFAKWKGFSLVYFCGNSFHITPTETGINVGQRTWDFLDKEIDDMESALHCYENNLPHKVRYRNS